MKPLATLLFAAALMALSTACGSHSAEADGALMLQQARQALSARQYNAARDTIMSLRRRFPTAIQARRQAILLLDSVEMTAAADSLQYADSTEWERLDIKMKFFERKLQEDQKRQ